MAFPLFFFSSIILTISCLPTMAKADSADECPRMLDGEMLDFASPQGIRLHKSTTGGCPRMLACDVISAPSETIIEWLFNGKVVQSSHAGELSNLLERTDGRSQLGLSETSHRICLEELLPEYAGGIWEAISGKRNKGNVRCHVRLDCNPSKWIESGPFDLGFPSKLTRRKERGINPVIGQRQNPMAPSITQITSSRMEVAGHVVQLTCKANSKNSNSRHQVDWTVIAEDGSRLENERKVDDGYPFIMKLSNGDLLVDTSMTDFASLSFRCRAKNKFGEDSATSTLILLKD